MKAGKRLYDMGGNILAEDSNFFPSNSASGSMWPKKNKCRGGKCRTVGARGIPGLVPGGKRKV